MILHQRHPTVRPRVLIPAVMMILACIGAAGTLVADQPPANVEPPAAAALPQDELARSMAAAHEAAAEGNDEQADKIYREILRRNPRNEPAYNELCALAEGQPLAIDSAPLEAARQLVGPAFTEHVSKRFVVLSQADAVWTRSQIELLERASHQFHRFAVKIGARPLPLRHKLVCIMFAGRDSYLEFAREHDELSGGWVSGHYSPRHDWTVFYDNRGTQVDAGDRQSLEEIRSRIAQLLKMAEQAAASHRDDQARALRQNAALAQDYLNQQHERLNDVSQRESQATSVHETIHQLLFHTRMQTPHVRYPLWICEGLATNFETDSPEQAFGPGYDYSPRRNRFRQLLSENSLIELKQLVQIDRAVDLDRATVDAVYNQSYALVAWMSRFRKNQLNAYLWLMLEQPEGEIAPPEQLRLFEQAFGDVESLERAWLRFERESNTTTLAPALADGH